MEALSREDCYQTCASVEQMRYCRGSAPISLGLSCHVVSVFPDVRNWGRRILQFNCFITAAKGVLARVTILGTSSCINRS